MIAANSILRPSVYSDLGSICREARKEVSHAHRFTHVTSTMLVCPDLPSLAARCLSSVVSNLRRGSVRCRDFFGERRLSFADNRGHTEQSSPGPARTTTEHISRMHHRTSQHPQKSVDRRAMLQKPHHDPRAAGGVDRASGLEEEAHGKASVHESRQSVNDYFV